MADSFLLNLTDALDNDPITVSEASTPSALSLRPSAGSILGLKRARPLSLSQDLIGHSFNDGGVRYTVRERSAVKRGAGKQSWIWEYGYRNRLTEDIIKATECLKRWYKAGY